MLKKDLVFLLALVVILFGIYWKTFNYDLVWDDDIFFKHNILFIENHPVSSAFKFGYFSEQLGVQVDLVMKKALKPNIGRYVLEEVVAV